jgi:hypothetical protein
MDTQISAGNALTKEASTAPAPRLTKRAGNAQQMSVEPLVASASHINLDSAFKIAPKN